LPVRELSPETDHKFDLLLRADSLKGTRKPNELGRHILTGE